MKLNRVKILFIAFEFPPLATGGVQRSLKFVKYLPSFGIQPVVLTTDLDSFQKVMPDSPVDMSLLGPLPSDTLIERVPCSNFEPRNRSRFAEWRRLYFSVAEGYKKQWWPQLAETLPHLLAKHKPRAIYVTVPPFCMAPLACKIKKRYGLPLILDLRDAWSQWRITAYGSWLHYWLTRRLEGKCLRVADRLVCTSDQTREDFLRVHPSIPMSKISVITNGYDEDVDDWKLDFHPNGKKFCIGYVGSFYYSPQARNTMMQPWWRKRPNRMIQFSPRKEDWLYRSPYFFFQAVARLLDKKPACRQRLQIRFAGQKPDWIESQVRQFNLDGLVEFVGRLDHTSSLDFQRGCDALLVTSSKIVGGRDYSIAGKTFEYFSMKKPIVGFVADGAQKDLLVASGMALVCNPDKPEEAASQLNELVEGRFEPKPNTDLLKQLHRRELTRRLAEAIKSVTKQVVS